MILVGNLGNAKFEIHETRQLSKELDREWEQEIVVSRAGETFLRLAGDGSEYRVMTATTGERNLGLGACKYPDILLQAAHKLSVKYVDRSNRTERDSQGKKYLPLFIFLRCDGDSDKDFTNGLRELLEEFFSIYDNLRKQNQSTDNDLQDLYGDLCHTPGEPVYLSDGIYLYPDGTTSSSGP